MIAIIDYDAENLRSVKKALLSLGEMLAITRDRKTILKVDKVVLPGVGPSGDAVGKPKRYNLVDVICGTMNQGIPFLGIYLGLQLLFTGSEENRGVAGLGILPGKILKTSEHLGLKIPHMGRNSLKIRPGIRLFYGVEDRAYAYSAHSYYLKAENKSVAAASTKHSTIIYASVERGSVLTCQFHPEKNGKVGFVIFKDSIGL